MTVNNNSGSSTGSVT